MPIRKPVISRGMSSLNWWQTAGACRCMSHLLGDSVLPLLVVRKTSDGFLHEVFTGFLLNHLRRLMWLTAGHVIDGLRSISTMDSKNIRHVCWMDNYPRENATSIPVDLVELVSNVNSASMTDSGLDFGVVALGLNQASLLRANPTMAELTSAIWEPPSLEWRVEGYCLVGYPESWVTPS